MTPLVAAESAGIDYGVTRVFEEIDLVIAPGTQTVITGRSGSGKSTLLLILAGLIEPSRGAVSWPGLSPDPRIRRGQIGMVFQAPSLMPELSALENVTLPLRLRGTSLATAWADSGAALATVGAADLADSRPAQLSGGQQQRVAVARVLAGRHLLVLADEPTGALDRENAQQVVSQLREAVTRAGGALLLATHDEEIAAGFTARLDLDSLAQATP
ncbi:MAG: ABC-type antimicrobial peptide transport system, ATPase component [Aeromicrobium sp.]|jgi:ABC-type lipoprotein export system ATPase subunit|nr:ABC-type antimicrobial peptide transport system, ATPase component [Aeromicrobium sp.]